jgi:hypothetical protein
MKNIWRIGLVITWLVAFGSPAPADESPFQGSCIRTALSSHGGVYESDLYGKATHVGPFIGHSIITFPQGHHAVGPVTITGAGGDSITLFTDIWFDKHFVAGYGSYVLTGGTGIFESANGSGAFQVVHQDDGQTVISWDGTISFGPS